MKNGIWTRILSLALTVALLLPLMPAALAEDAPVGMEGLYEIAMTPHPDGYHADPETMTDEEWAAQFACDVYMEEGNAALELSQMAGTDINPVDFIKMITSMKDLPDLISKLNFWTLDFLWKAFIQGDGEDAKFKAIMGKLKDIEQKLDKLTHAHKIDLYEKYLNDQLDRRTRFVSSMRGILNELADIDDALNRKDNKKITKEEAAKRRKAAIKRFGTTPMLETTDGVAATFYYVNYVMQQRIRGRNFIGMLDDYVYISLPWEHQGYQARELLRSAEMSTMFAAMALSGMYLAMEGKLDTRTGKELNKLILDVAKWYEKQPVVRAKDFSVCQIRGEQGSKFWRGTIDFSERLSTGETIEYNVRKWQMRGTVNDYIIRGNTANEDDHRKAKIVSQPSFEVLMNFYGQKKTVEEIWQNEIQGVGSAVRFICFKGFCGGSDYTQNNTLITTTSFTGDVKDPINYRNSWVGYYWEDNRTTYFWQKRVRGWHKHPDSAARMIPYEKGILIRPDSPQDHADENTFTYSGPVVLTEDGYLAVLNVTNTDFMYGDEPDAPPPPVLEAPEGGLVTDLFSVADTYLGRDFDISGLDLGDGLKPGQWVTITGTLNDNEDGPWYKATDIQAMDIEGVPGTIAQLSDELLTFLPEDGEELALVVNDSAQLSEDIAEGSQVTLFYHPELVYNDDEDGFCDHQQLILDRVDPYDQEEGTLDGIVSALMDDYLTVVDEAEAEHVFQLTEETRMDDDIDEGSQVRVTYHVPKDETTVAESVPIADDVALLESPIDPDEEEEMDGVITYADENTLRLLAEDGQEYEFDISGAQVEGETAEGNTAHVVYQEGLSGFIATQVTCFAPDDDPDVDDADDDQPVDDADAVDSDPTDA